MRNIITNNCHPAVVKMGPKTAGGDSIHCVESLQEWEMALALHIRSVVEFILKKGVQ